jgi:hypothetical protein
MAMPLATLPARGPLGSTEAEANGVEVFIENLEIGAHIGAHAHERGAAQGRYGLMCVSPSGSPPSIAWITRSTTQNLQTPFVGLAVASISC